MEGATTGLYPPGEGHISSYNPETLSGDIQTMVRYVFTTYLIGLTVHDFSHLVPPLNTLIQLINKS